MRPLMAPLLETRVPFSCQMRCDIAAATVASPRPPALNIHISVAGTQTDPIFDRRVASACRIHCNEPISKGSYIIVSCFSVPSTGASHSLRLAQKTSIAGAHSLLAGPRSIVPEVTVTAAGSMDSLLINNGEPQFEQNDLDCGFPDPVPLSWYTLRTSSPARTCSWVFR